MNRRSPKSPQSKSTLVVDFGADEEAVKRHDVGVVGVAAALQPSGQRSAGQRRHAREKPLPKLVRPRGISRSQPAKKVRDRTRCIRAGDSVGRT